MKQRRYLEFLLNSFNFGNVKASCLISCIFFLGILRTLMLSALIKLEKLYLINLRGQIFLSIDQ